MKSCPSSVGLEVGTLEIEVLVEVSRGCFCLADWQTGGGGLGREEQPTRVETHWRRVAA